MQSSLPEWIDSFIDALTEPYGLATDNGAHLTHEQALHFRACAELVGLSSDALQDRENGTTAVNPLEATQMIRQLLAAKRALNALPEQNSTKPYLIEEFSVDAMTNLKAPEKTPELNRLLRGTFMMAVTKDDHIYKSLSSTLSTRGETLDAIELLRPDIAGTVRENMTKLALDSNVPGMLPVTPKQIRDFQFSYRAVTKHLGQDGNPDKAQETLERIRAESPFKTKPERRESGPVISRITPEGRKLMVLSERPRADSVDEFLLPLEQIEPLRDTLKRVAHAQDSHNDGAEERIRRNAGECWLDYGDRLHMVARGRNLYKLAEHNLETLEAKFPGTLEALDKVECVTVYPQRDSKKDVVVRQKLSEAHEAPHLDDKTRQSIIQHRGSFHLSLPLDLLPALGHEEVTLRERTSAIKEQFEHAVSLEGDARQTETAKAQESLSEMLRDYDAVLPEKFTAATVQTSQAASAYSK